MIGLILAGGTGRRLNPLTKATSKQLLAIYDKPMIYYPITTLMFAGIKKFLIVVTPKTLENYRELLGDGANWGIEIEYLIQEAPKGIAQSLQLVPKKYHEESCVLILGDNLFYGMGLGSSLKSTFNGSGSIIFAYEVANPSDYGVVNFDEEMKPLDIVEKPSNPLSNFAIPGLYYFDHNCYELAKTLLPSSRGELEITDLIRFYLKNKAIRVKVLARGTAWLDTGSPENLLSAANFVKVVEDRQGMKIGCPEEVAFREGLIDEVQLTKLIDAYPEGDYRKYLKKIRKEWNSPQL